jgi:hypothetical protein
MKTKAEKRKEAQARQAYWESLTDQEKLYILNLRLKPNTGASKQRAKLAARNEKPQ